MNFVITICLSEKSVIRPLISEDNTVLICKYGSKILDSGDYEVGILAKGAVWLTTTTPSNFKEAEINLCL